MSDLDRIAQAMYQVWKENKNPKDCPPWVTLTDARKETFRRMARAGFGVFLTLRGET